MTMRSAFLCIFFNLIVLYQVTAKHDRLAKHRVGKFKAVHKILFRVNHHRIKPTGRTLQHGKRLRNTHCFATSLWIWKVYLFLFST